MRGSGRFHRFSVLLLIPLCACSTIRYGRMQPLGNAEKAALDCPGISLEIAKCDDFTNNVYAEFSESGGKRFLGYMGDFGIGNNMEMNDALYSSSIRRGELVNLHAAKHCSTTLPIETPRR